MKDAHKVALAQLRDVERNSSGTFEIVQATESGSDLHVEISIACDGYVRAPEGLSLNARERFHFFVPENFPFSYPSILTRHTRFAGHPHVQFGRHLCLYQAPNTEWNPNDGMFGFIARLDAWLEHGAKGELDPVGAPLHPPVAYISDDSPLVIPRINAPVASGEPWFGFAHIVRPTDYRYEIQGWSSLPEKVPESTVAGAAILLDKPMPFEFPSTMVQLISELVTRGVPQNLVLLLLQLALMQNAEQDPLFLVLGTPMRGIRGSGNLRQHLAVWSVSSLTTRALRLALEKYSPNPALKEIGQDVEKLILDWASSTNVVWCSVHEDRPEIVQRRDEHTPMAWFRGKSVSLWGCGALGSHIAELLTRAGVKKLSLHDKSIVTPGILVRQTYDDADIGRPKAVALQERLKRIRPDIEIETSARNLVNGPLASEDWPSSADLVIDTSASNIVASKLELVRLQQQDRRAPVASLVVGHEAENGVLVLARAEHTGGIVDVSRKAKLATCAREELQAFADEFWPKEARSTVFQPEPGCSEPTFIGSAASISRFAAQMLTLLSSELTQSDGSTASAHFLAAPIARLGVSHRRFSWSADLICRDPDSGYEIRIAPSAYKEIYAWCKRKIRLGESEIETGGLLFGERNQVCKVIWITEVLGPPPDSDESRHGFICGTEGVSPANQEKKRRTRESVGYVGTWHTHPNEIPAPSSTDLSSLYQLDKESSANPQGQLLLIVSPSESRAVIAAYLFERDKLRNPDNYPDSQPVNFYITSVAPQDRRVGLALSGGGSRAIAFHLGCLRALHDRGLLPQVEVISAVSGGSIIAGLYAYSDGSFEDFDREVVSLLREGLVSGIVRNFLSPKRLVGSVGTALTSGLVAAASNGLAVLVSASAMGREHGPVGSVESSDRIQPPFRRWMSRAVALDCFLASRLGDVRLPDSRRHGMQVVFNACELRTGTAFRFGSRESGSWRFGKLKNNDVFVAHAIAASAAYPIFLPAFDERMIFVGRGGDERTERVILTDGGVYDNLGTSCLEPGRSESFSFNVFQPRYIIACDAGPGLLSEHVHPYWWPSRVRRSFEATHRRISAAAYERLHRHAASGELDGFLLVYLGQRDAALPVIPPDLPRREDVFGYPTDFSPMTDAAIAALAKRGEILARLLIERYTPEL